MARNIYPSSISVQVRDAIKIAISGDVSVGIGGYFQQIVALLIPPVPVIRNVGCRYLYIGRV
jgi:hypothetical protein